MTVAAALVGALLTAPAGTPASPVRLELDVPLLRAGAERCGQAAFAMVLRYYGAGSIALREADRAYDASLRGSLITDLAAAARRAGFRAEAATLTPDSLIALLHEGVPPILLYQSGPGPFTRPHYGVVRGWDPARDAFLVNDGGARPRLSARRDLLRRWRTAGSQALVIRRGQP
jgi:ABC-type bacteriocin/lantibiotic exporter with double-glycine peptidase domain